MLYLLDANILITANSSYYPMDQVPEFWSWLQYQGASGRVKISLEIMEEVREGRRVNDPLIDWISQDENADALLFGEIVDATLVQRVVSIGYADDLTDDEVEKIGRDPFFDCLCALQSLRKVRRNHGSVEAIGTTTKPEGSRCMPVARRAMLRAVLSQPKSWISHGVEGQWELARRHEADWVLLPA
jgi:hypothetical protein